MTRSAAPSLALLIASGLFACTESTIRNPPPPPQAADASAGDAQTPSDGGPTDSSSVDSGALDQGALGDATVPDASPTDATLVDGAAPDATAPDAGPTDAVALDEGAGPLDAAAPDAESVDALVLDASRPDAAAGDAGVVNLSCDPGFGQPDACGGNPVGVWQFRVGCLDTAVFAPLQAGCPSATTSNINQTVSGTLELSAVGTYTRNSVDLITGDIDVPASCAPAAIGGCPGAAALIQSAIPGSSVACTTRSNQSCDCDVAINNTVADVGTYSLDPANGTATINPTAGNAEQVYYCVDAGVLRFRGVPGASTVSSVTYVLSP